MAKLNTYAENIQLKSNIVDSDLPSRNWTAEQYPSARSLYEAFDKIHPIGSVLCMSENINPAQLYNHGTWELVDKELKTHWQALATSGWTAINATADSLSGCLVSGHSLTLRLVLHANTNEINDDGGLDLGTIDTTQFGLKQFPMLQYCLPITIDGGEISGNVTIEQNGLVTLNDAWNSQGEHIIDSTYAIPISASYTISDSNMLDSFCNKFYFKRTA